MAASGDRIPPPFPAAEEPGAGDSDEGEDIFVNNVCLQPTATNENPVVLLALAGSERAALRLVRPGFMATHTLHSTLTSRFTTQQLYKILHFGLSAFPDAHLLIKNHGYAASFFVLN